MNIFVLANPQAGMGRAIEALGDVIKAVRALKAKTRIKILEKSEKISDVIQYADESFDYLIAIGGDGTIKSVVDGILKSKNKITLVTYLGGSGGEVARYAGILSYTSLKNALLEENITRVDVFRARIRFTDNRVEEHNFVANLQIGHFAHGICLTPQIAKKIFGGTGYMLGVLKALVARRNVPAKVIGDNNHIYSGLVYTIHFGNVATTRGGVPVAPLADPTDGKIDMMLARGINQLEALHALPMVLRGEHLKHPAVIYKQLRNVTVISKGDHIAVDGEYLGSFTHLKILYSGKIALLCSRSSSR